jgi:hypothetical protein
MNRNNGRLGRIKNLAISLKLWIFHSPAISGDAGNFAYLTSGDYRAHLTKTEYWKATTLAESKMMQINH